MEFPKISTYTKTDLFGTVSEGSVYCQGSETVVKQNSIAGNTGD